MSTAESHLTLHLHLDEIENNQVEDASGNGRHGTLAGAPVLVADSLFGSCLRLDGRDDSVLVADADITKLPEPEGNVLPVGVLGARVEASPPHTIAGWVRLERYPSGRAWILNLGQHSPGAYHWLVSSDGTTHIGGWSGTQFTPTLPLGRWVHIATSFDGTNLRCLIDGAAIGERPARFSYTNYELALGKPGQAELYFAGDIANVRLYSRALSDDEIQQAIEDDQAASAAFRRSHPLDFSLHDDDDQPVLAIVDDPLGHGTHLEITNTASQTIVPDTPADPNDARRDNHHYELRFRPGTLAESATPIAIFEPGWVLGRLLQSDDTLSLFLLQSSPQPLAPGAKLKLTLQNVAADGRGGARGTRVELHYQQLKYQGEPTPIGGMRTQYLSIINERGQRNIPLHLGFVGANSVLADGLDNRLTLRLVNSSPDQTIRLDADGDAPTVLFLSFDTVPAGSAHSEGALGKFDDVGAIGVQVDGWTVHKETEEAETPRWRLVPNAATSLPPGEDVHIQLSNIDTLPGAGQANVYLQYKNIYGYWDGQLVAAIEKGPLVVKDQAVGGKLYSFVGVGTAAPVAKLQIVHEDQDANGNALIIGPSNAPHLRLGYHQNYSWVQSHGSKPLALNPIGNNVGVGITNPQAKLHVAGGAARFDGGLSVAGGQPVGGIPVIDFQQQQQRFTGHRGSAKELIYTFTFARPVLAAQPALTSWFLRYEIRDFVREIGVGCYRVTITGNQVSVQVMFYLKDNTGVYDDPYEGEANVVVFAKLAQAL
jgi:hypothetical protein